jgi:hypothetical protein
MPSSNTPSDLKTVIRPLGKVSGAAVVGPAPFPIEFEMQAGSGLSGCHPNRVQASLRPDGESGTLVLAVSLARGPLQTLDIQISLFRRVLRRRIRGTDHSRGRSS